MDDSLKSRAFRLFAAKKSIEELVAEAGIPLEAAKELRRQYISLIGHPNDKRDAFTRACAAANVGTKPQRICEFFAGGEVPGEGGGMTRVFEKLSRLNAQTSIRSYYDTDGEATDVCKRLIDRGNVSFTIIDLDVYGQWTLYHMLKTGVLKLADPAGCMLILTIPDRARGSEEQFNELLDVVGSRGPATYWKNFGEPMGPDPSHFVVYANGLAEKLGLQCRELDRQDFEKEKSKSWVMTRIHLWLEKKKPA